MEQIKIDATKRGIAAMWESGGGLTSGGSATLITGRNGEARRPVYMPRGGHLACGNHAFITVHEGYHIVRASVSHGERNSATISRIISVSVKDIGGERFEATAEVEVLNTFSRGEWDRPLDQKFEAAVKAAFSKASSYHCRSAYYVDASDKPQPTDADKQRRDEEMRRQDAERARLRQLKADAEARAKADAEASSKAAKASGLGARLEAASARLTALGHGGVELGDAYFKWGFDTNLYTEESVRYVEGYATHYEAQAAENRSLHLAREAFLPRFEALKPRAEALGLKIALGPEKVYLTGSSNGFLYTAAGLASLEEHIAIQEKEVAVASAKAEAAARYEARKAEASAQGLPQNVKIWRRTGRTNAGNGWVIGRDGVEREPTSMENPNPRRLARYGEGFMVWDQILPGELVLKWSKACSSAEHVFEVVHLPATGLTKEQSTHVAMLQEDIEREWAGATGLSSGDPSPPVGDGWGLIPKSAAKGAAGPATLEALKSRFNKR